MNYKRNDFGLTVLLLTIFIITSGWGQAIMDKKNYNKLSTEEKRVIIHKGTEMPFTGKYDTFDEKGTYTCKQCNAPLYQSDAKFSSGCGWPSFDDEIEGAVDRRLDTDGRRTEILCANCGAHLGHVFEGEGLTSKNIRHCVNSISMTFIPLEETAKAYFAGGCFWGVEYLLEKKVGVISAESGYMGGTIENPSYQDIINKQTGHLETVEVVYDPSRINYEDLAKFFFEIHDPTQKNGQGPDIGDQYMSAIFYNNNEEKNTSFKLIDILMNKGYKVVTKVLPASHFWTAEAYHQNYYKRKQQLPYCHAYQKKF